MFWPVSGLAALFLCAALHEAAHWAAGRLFGLKTEGLDLGPAGLAVTLPGVELLPPLAQCAVYLSGPALNLALALGARALGFRLLFVINAALGCFNLLPARSLDGGRALFAALSRNAGFMRASRVFRRIDALALAAILAAGVLQALLYPWNVSLICLSAFLYVQCGREASAQCLRFMRHILCSGGQDRSRLPERTVTLPPGACLKTLFDCLSYSSRAVFRLPDGRGGYLAVKEERMLDALKVHGMYADALMALEGLGHDGGPHAAPLAATTDRVKQ